MGLLDGIFSSKLSNPALVSQIEKYRADLTDESLVDLWQKFLKAKVLLATSPEGARAFGKLKQIKEAISLPFTTTTNDKGDNLLAVFADSEAFQAFAPNATPVMTTGELVIQLASIKGFLGVTVNPGPGSTELKIWQHQLFIEKVTDTNKLHSLAMKLVRSGNYLDAQGVLKGAIAVAQKDPGPQHPYTAELNVELAKLMRQQGRAQEAEWVYRRAYSIYEGSSSHALELASTGEALGTLLVELKKSPQAEPFFLRALDIYENIPGAKPDSLARLFGQLAEIKLEQSATTDAENLYKRASVALEERKRPELMEVLNKMGALCEKEQRPKEALVHYMRAIAIFEQYRRCRDIDLATATHRAAVLHLENDNPQESLSLLERALAAYRRDGTDDEVAQVESLIEIAKQKVAEFEFKKQQEQIEKEKSGSGQFGRNSGKRANELPLLDFQSFKATPKAQYTPGATAKSSAPEKPAVTNDPEEQALADMRAFLDSVSEVPWNTESPANSPESNGSQDAMDATDASDLDHTRPSISEVLESPTEPVMQIAEVIPAPAPQSEAQPIEPQDDLFGLDSASDQELIQSADRVSDSLAVQQSVDDSWSISGALDKLLGTNEPAETPPSVPSPPVIQQAIEEAPPAELTAASSEQPAAPVIEEAVSLDDLFDTRKPEKLEEPATAPVEPQLSAAALFLDYEPEPVAPVAETPPAIKPEPVAPAAGTLSEIEQEPAAETIQTKWPEPPAVPKEERVTAEIVKARIPRTFDAPPKPERVQASPADEETPAIFQMPVDADVSGAFDKSLLSGTSGKTERFDKPISERSEVTEPTEPIVERMDTSGIHKPGLFARTIDGEISAIFNKSMIRPLQKSERFDKPVKVEFSDYGDDPTANEAATEETSPAAEAVEPPVAEVIEPPVTEVIESPVADILSTPAPTTEDDDDRSLDAAFESLVQERKPDADRFDKPIQERNLDADRFDKPIQERNLDADRFDKPIQERNLDADRFDKPIQERNLDADRFDKPIQERNLDADRFDKPIQERNLDADRFDKPIQERNLDASRFDKPIQERNLDASRFDTPIQERNLDASRFDTPIQERNLDASRFDKPIQERNLDPSRFDKPIQERMAGAAASSSSDSEGSLFTDLDSSLGDAFDKILANPTNSASGLTPVKDSAEISKPSLDPSRFDKPIQERNQDALPNAGAQVKQSGSVPLPPNIQARIDESEASGAKTPDDLIRLLEREITADPRNTDQWLRKGAAMVQQGKHDEAIKIFDKVTVVSPNNVQAWYCKGSALALKSRHEDALYCFNHLLNLEKDHIKGMLRKAECLLKLGRNDQSMIIYDRIIALQPGFVPGWLSKAKALLQQRKFEEALSCYDHVLGIDPQNEEANKAKNLINSKLGAAGR